ncbi:MAG TPA: undecaprenyl-diphosphate phosphatase [Methylomirabilota bacterium]|nr:undecaprenyl-diphosphate phosphatase [Methylomirabilota bacterium]
MSYTQAVVLGLVQGLTEFLPISSSGHLILVPRVFGWPDQGLAFDAALHLGTLAALVAYFRSELIGVVVGSVSRGLAAIVVIATVPAGLAALAFGGYIENSLRWPLLIAFTTAFWGIVMLIADRRPAPARVDSASSRAAPGDPLERVSWGQGLAVGCAQALALIPGTSRSGITITTGLFAGLDRPTAARYSFLLGIPITAAAGLKKSFDLSRGGLPVGEGGPLVIAILVSFLSGWFAVWFLVSYLKRRSLTPFVIYRLALAALIVAVWYR